MEPAATRPDPAPAAPPRAPRRRAGRLASAGAITEAATTLFLSRGFQGTSMDDIAALAAVSKQTVYTHFADKETLFTELVLANTARSDAFVESLAGALDDTATAEDLERDLRGLARRYAAVVVQPPVLQMRRLVLAEAGRFPDLARAYHDRIPQRVIATLAERLQRLAERGLLRVPDPVLAAGQLAWLVLGVPLDRAMFHGAAGGLPPAEVERLADAGVDVFLAAYAVR